MTRAVRSFHLFFAIAAFAALAIGLPSQGFAAVLPSGNIIFSSGDGDPMDPTQWDATRDLVVSYDAPASVWVDTTGGASTVATKTLAIGCRLYPGTGDVTVTGGGASWTSYGIGIGTGNYGDGGSNGTLNVLDGANVTVNIGNDPDSGPFGGGVTVGATGSRGTLSVGGGTFSVATNLSMGSQGGTATMNISNGGVVNVANETYLARDTSIPRSSVATINFGAGGGTLTTRSLLGSLTNVTGGTGNITAYGLVTDGTMSFGSEASKVQTFTPNGVNVTLDLSDPARNGHLGIGYGTTGGSMTISNGITIHSLAAHMGDLADSSGTATVDGATWSVDGYANNEPIDVGMEGSGTLVVKNGGVLTNNPAGNGSALRIGVNAGSTGTVTVKDSNSTLSNTFIITVGGKGTGMMEVLNNATVNSNVVAIGNTYGSGTVTIDASTWSNTFAEGYFDVGHGGVGTLAIKNGGVLNTNGSVTLSGYSNGTSKGTSTVTIDGPGSVWNSSGATYKVGAGGPATLSIANGGLLEDTSANPIIIAYSYCSSGTATATATVDGTGSSLTTSKQIYVGCKDYGALNVKNGGYVATGSGNGILYIGGTASSTAPTSHVVGEVSVDGAGSRLLVGAPTTAILVVGLNGVGSMSITNGGAVTNYSCYLAGHTTTSGQAGTSATVTISGAGSTWTNESTVNVGYKRGGTVNLDGGTMIANSIKGAGSGGTMTFNFNGGTLKPYSTGSATWIATTGTSNLYVKEGGAIFDTTGVSSTAISLPLQHGGTAASDGGVTKLGTGQLTLSGLGTYTGWTTVSGGTLSLGQISLYDASNVRVDTGTALNLTFSGPDTVHWLFLGGLAQAAGTYDVSNSGGFITGGGSLYVSATALQGDADLNGTVNSTDLGLLLSHYNQVGTGFAWGLGDFDANGTVNSTDLGLLLSHYNQTSAATSAVPEPSTLLLLAAGLIGLLAYAWRKK